MRTSTRLALFWSWLHRTTPGLPAQTVINGSTSISHGSRNCIIHGSLLKISLELSTNQSQAVHTYKVIYVSWSNMMTSSNGNVFRVTGTLWGGGGIHRSPVDSPHNDQWRGALMFSLICALTKQWEQTIETPVIWDTIAFIMTSL